MRKDKKITIRITETQLRRLTDKIIEEETTKSNLLREMIEKTVRSCRKEITDGKRSKSPKSLISLFKSMINEKRTKINLIRILYLL